MLFKKKQEEQRPFFSIVISCFNSGRYINKLLNSLVDQGLKKEDYEIIIADDCSTKPFKDKVDKFEDKLNIKWIVADHNYGYPGHTREMGVSIATGIWVIFSDHDDLFVERSLCKAKKYLKKNPQIIHVLKTKVLTSNQGVVDKSKVTMVSGITHGIFFNLDNFWKKFDIHYLKHIKTNEDIYILQIMNSLNDAGFIKIYYTWEFIVYIWEVNNELSLGKVSNIKNDYMEKSIADYLACISAPYEVLAEKNVEGFNESLLGGYITTLLYAYFLIQYYKYNNQDYFLFENEVAAAKIVIKAKGLYKNIFNKEFIMDCYTRDKQQMYFKTMHIINIGNNLRVIPLESLNDWLDYIFDLASYMVYHEGEDDNILAYAKKTNYLTRYKASNEIK